MSVFRQKLFLSNCVTVEHAKQIHALIIVNCHKHLEPILIHRILQYTREYTRSILNYVKKILCGLQNPDSFSWGCLTRFLSKHGQFKEAFRVYTEMGQFGVSPSSHAISSTLRACARIEDNVGGTSVHAQILKHGFYGCVYVQTGLVDFYSKLGHIEMATKVFGDIAEKNTVSWNSILSGYLKCGNLVEASRIFAKIPKKDVVSWNLILLSYTRAGNMDQACSFFQLMPEKSPRSWNTMISGYLDIGETKLARTFFDTMPQKDNVSWTTMISGYAKSGDVESAKALFGQIKKKDTLLYNAMIACYAQNNQPKEALELFSVMHKTNSIQPDEVTLSSIVSACSQLGDTRFGFWVESYMAEHEIVMDDHTGTALIDLYMKGGNFAKAFELFHSLEKKDTVAYSTMITGCGINGKAPDAIILFQEMIEKRIHPNLVTFTGLLTAYSHAGLVKEGYRCFMSMEDFNLKPSVDHYGIMVDMLGRAGKLEEAYELIKSMPMQPNAGVWGALLLASDLHHSVEFGEIAAKNCVQLEGDDPSGYLSLLANIYTSVGRRDDAQKLRKSMEEKKLCKTLGCSWVESA